MCDEGSCTIIILFCSQFSVEVLDIVKRTLPVASAAAQFAGRVTRPVDTAPPVDSPETTKDQIASTYSDTNLTHYATVETEHPYKQATVSHFRVSDKPPLLAGACMWACNAPRNWPEVVGGKKCGTLLALGL